MTCYRIPLDVGGGIHYLSYKKWPGMSDSKINSEKNDYTAGDNFFKQMVEAGIADDNFIREIVEMFLEEGMQTLGKLRNAFANNESENVRLFAHKLKSSFLMFDMHEAHSFAMELEKVDDESVADYIEALKGLETACSSNFDLLREKYLN